MLRIALGIAALCVVGVGRSQADDVLLSENFAQPSEAWSSSGGAQVAGGKLVLTAEADESCSYLYAGHPWGDVDIRVTVARTSGDTTRFDTASIAFWNDNQGSYYLASIAADGTFAVRHSIEDGFKDIVAPRKTNLIRTDPGQTNTVRLVTQGDYVTMYVNDRQLVAFNATPPKQGGFVGMVTGAGEDKGNTWEFSDFSIRKAPPLTPGDLIFADDFASLEPQWTGGNGRARVENHQLFVTGEPGVLTHLIGDQRPVGNADVRVKITQTKGDEQGFVGITFWADNDYDFYVALIRPSGMFSVLRFNSRGWSAPCMWREEAAIKTGVGQPNELRVVTQGSTATIFVNQKQVSKLRGSPTLGCTKVGLYTLPQQQATAWTFSDFNVFKSPIEGELKDLKEYDNQFFVDDFTTFDPAWGFPSENARVENKSMILEPPVNGQLWQIYNGDVFQDVNIRVTVTELEGDPTAAAGIVFWKIDAQNYYQALISCDGYFILQRVTPAGVVNMSNWHMTSKVNGVGQPTKLAITIRGKEVTFALGEKVAAFDGTPPGASSYVGIIAGSTADKPCKWAFSDFELWKPEPELQF
jgi:hypothetical protein